MGWWKADSTSDPQPSAPLTAPASPQTSETKADESACPVDPKTREVWLRQAKQQTQSQSQSQSKTASPALPASHPPIVLPPSSPAKAFATSPSEQCSSDRIDQTPTAGKIQPFRNLRPLSQDREVSTIPRAYTLPTPAVSSSSAASATEVIPSNAEAETGHDKSSGNWIYPSESQFFTAVMRKHPEATSPAELASSISSIIPIHNAVNERAWSLIRQWEASSPITKTCNGPKLLRFEGKGAGAKSPRARMKSWSGYQEPFDRHDWTVQRCDGAEIDYIIDFYQGKSPAGQVSPAGPSGQQGLNFYLDVRPKLNSLEGCKLRFQKFVGWR